MYGDFIWNRADAETRAAAIATFIIEVVLCTKGILFAGGEQKLKRAKKDGKILIYIIPVLVAFAVMTALGFRP